METLVAAWDRMLLSVLQPSEPVPFPGTAAGAPASPAGREGKAAVASPLLLHLPPSAPLPPPSSSLPPTSCASPGAPSLDLRGLHWGRLPCPAQRVCIPRCGRRPLPRRGLWGASLWASPPEALAQPGTFATLLSPTACGPVQGPSTHDPWSGTPDSSGRGHGGSWSAEREHPQPVRRASGALG